MKHLFPLGMALLVALPAFALTLDHVDGEILLVLDETTPLLLEEGAAPLARDASLAPILEEYGLARWDWISQKTGELSADERRFIRLFSDIEEFDELAAQRDLEATGLFRAVSVNHIHQLMVLPNDPMLGDQWAVTNNTAGIKLPQAWDVTTGDASAVVAILDTGVDVGHEDLAGNMWHNPGEVPGNGQDDDNNGYIDDVWGWDAGDNDNDPSPVPYYEGGIDVGFHGTHCAGCASAATDNSTGIAGSGWDTSIMGVKMVQEGVGMTDVAITNSFNYVVATQPDVISMSFGGPDQGGMAQFMQELIDMALAKNIVCVAAAGNNGDSQMMYPGACDGVIAVGATNSSNQRASFSTYGNWVDIAAPGEHIWSCVQSNYEWDVLTALMMMLMYGYDGINPYMYCDGTSMACPIAAGVCGMVRNLAPNMSSEEMAQHLHDTGDVVSYDHPIGRKINAYEAVSDLDNTGLPGDAPLAFGIRGNSPNPFNPKTRIHFALESDGPAALAIYDAQGRLIRDLFNGPLEAGSHQLSWNGLDDDGDQVASGIYFARLRSGDQVQARKMVMLK